MSVPFLNSLVFHDENETRAADYDLSRLFAPDRINSTRFHSMLLYSLAMSEKARVMVELGCLFGNTTALLAHAASRNGGRVWAVDNNYDGPCLAWTDEHLTALDLRQHVDLVEAATWENEWWAKDRAIDLVFVDSQHERTAIDRDFSAWGPRLRLGGFIAFHDIGGGELAEWANDTWPHPCFEHIAIPGDCGLLLARRIR